MDVTIHDSRKKVLQAEFEKPYFSDIKSALIEEKKQYTIYPPAKLIFNAFDTTPFDTIKVIIL
jgi:uracil-DNA glycosylase